MGSCLALRNLSVAMLVPGENLPPLPAYARHWCSYAQNEEDVCCLCERVISMIIMMQCSLQLPKHSHLEHVDDCPVGLMRSYFANVYWNFLSISILFRMILLHTTCIMASLHQKSRIATNETSLAANKSHAISTTGVYSMLTACSSLADQHLYQ